VFNRKEGLNAVKGQAVVLFMIGLPDLVCLPDPWPCCEAVMMAAGAGKGSAVPEWDGGCLPGRLGQRDLFTLHHDWLDDVLSLRSILPIGRKAKVSCLALTNKVMVRGLIAAEIPLSFLSGQESLATMSQAVAIKKVSLFSIFRRSVLWVLHLTCTLSVKGES
jgi:hypothetical protein